MIDFKIRLFHITFTFQINVRDDSPDGGVNKLTYFRLSLSHYYRFWNYGLELSKWSTIGFTWDTKVWLYLFYGNQGFFTKSRHKEVLIKNYNDGLFHN